MDEQARYPHSRYHLSPLAQRQLVIRNQVPLVAMLARLEEATPDFNQVNRLLTGRLVNATLTSRVTQQLLNLRTAVAFITSSPQGFDLLTFGHINDLATEGIGLNGGELRTLPLADVGQQSVQWPVPQADQVQRDLVDLRLQHADYTDRAVHALAYILRHQLYRDGNTATAWLVANQLLLKRGAGILLLTPDQLAEYQWSAANFYHKPDATEIFCQWLYRNALRGPEDLA